MSVKPDLSRFPEITHVNAWFFCIDDDIVKAMEPLGHALERAQNAVRFAWFSEGDARLMHCLEPEEDHLRAGFFAPHSLSLFPLKTSSRSISLRGGLRNNGYGSMKHRTHTCTSFANPKPRNSP